MSKNAQSNLPTRLNKSFDIDIMFYKLIILLGLFTALTATSVLEDNHHHTGSDYKVIQRHDCGHPEETGRNEDLVVRNGESIIVVKEPQSPDLCSKLQKQIFTWSFFNKNPSICELILHCDDLHGGYGSRYHLGVFLQKAQAEPNFIEEVGTAKFTKHYLVESGDEFLLALSFQGEDFISGEDEFQCGIYYRCKEDEKESEEESTQGGQDSQLFRSSPDVNRDDRETYPPEENDPWPFNGYNWPQGHGPNGYNDFHAGMSGEESRQGRRHIYPWIYQHYPGYPYPYPPYGDPRNHQHRSKPKRDDVDDILKWEHKYDTDDNGIDTNRVEGRGRYREGDYVDKTDDIKRFMEEREDDQGRLFRTAEDDGNGREMKDPYSLYMGNLHRESGNNHMDGGNCFVARICPMREQGTDAGSKDVPTYYYKRDDEKDTTTTLPSPSTTKTSSSTTSSIATSTTATIATTSEDKSKDKGSYKAEDDF